MSKATHRDNGVPRKGRLLGTSEIALTKGEAEELRRLMDKQVGRRPRTATPVPAFDPSDLPQKAR